jgi:hypothetical protein
MVDANNPLGLRRVELAFARGGFTACAAPAVAVQATAIADKLLTIGTRPGPTGFRMVVAGSRVGHTSEFSLYFIICPNV